MCNFIYGRTIFFSCLLFSRSKTLQSWGQDELLSLAERIHHRRHRHHRCHCHSLGQSLRRNKLWGNWMTMRKKTNCCMRFLVQNGFCLCCLSHLNHLFALVYLFALVCLLNSYQCPGYLLHPEHLHFLGCLTHLHRLCCFFHIPCLGSCLVVFRVCGRVVVCFLFIFL